MSEKVINGRDDELLLAKGTNTGWKIELFQNTSKISNYLCKHCKNVCYDAVELGCSQHNDNEYLSYCNDCLQALVQNNNNQCPINLHSNPIINISRGFRRNILKSLIICPYSNHGCSFNRSLKEFIQTKHLEECNKKYQAIDVKIDSNKFYENKDDNISVRERLLKFYEVYNPQTLHQPEIIDTLLERYEFMEQQLFVDLYKKYIASEPIITDKKFDIHTKLQNITPTDTTITVLSNLSQIYHQHIVDNETSDTVQLNYNKTNTIILVYGFSKQYVTYIPHDLVLTICIFYHNQNIAYIEALYNFEEFYGEPCTEYDFISKPMVMLLGQTSTGKTSFLRYLMNNDFLGMPVGAERTTNTFSVIMHGMKYDLIPGNSVVTNSTSPFAPLKKFGVGFLHKFNCIKLNASILKYVTFVDTPGLIFHSRSRLGRNYDFSKVIQWFANKCLKIIFFYDTRSECVSDELDYILEMLKPYRDKICCVLNKADCVRPKELMCVYGQMMWCLGKSLYGCDVCKVYCGSFWDKDYNYVYNADLFNLFANELIDDLTIGLQNECVGERVNKLVKRLRKLKTWILIIEHLRKESISLKSKINWFWDKNKNKKNEIFEDLRTKFKNIAKEQKLFLADFPHPDTFKDKMSKYDVTKYPKLKKKWIVAIDHVLNIEIKEICQKLSLIENNGHYVESHEHNPFSCNPENESPKWAITSSDFDKYSKEFYRMRLRGGKASGQQIKSIMMESGLSVDILKRIWSLSDSDNDGMMDVDEFALCMYLIQTVKNGETLPNKLTI